MPRALRFRVYNRETKEMIIPDENNNLIFEEKGRWFLMTWDGKLICNFTNGDIMQSAGLTDRNKIKIYEGDLFGKMGGDTEKPNEYEIHAEVYFDEDLSAFCVKNSNGSWDYLNDYLTRPKNQKEIIGNIYEHPHLLTP